MKRFPLELVLWISALISLMTMVPGEQHYSLCVLDQMGIKNCPGCGMGRSIHALLNGHWESSWQWHILGLPALLIIVVRIIQLVKNYFTPYKRLPYEPSK